MQGRMAVLRRLLMFLEIALGPQDDSAAGQDAPSAALHEAGLPAMAPDSLSLVSSHGSIAYGFAEAVGELDAAAGLVSDEVKTGVSAVAAATAASAATSSVSTPASLSLPALFAFAQHSLLPVLVRAEIERLEADGFSAFGRL